MMAKGAGFIMKRLVVFCDGTWNDTRMASLTNVARLAKCVEPTDTRGPTPIQQVVFYDSGVGITSGVSRLTDFLVRLKGGAFGRGLDEKIENAYRFLVLNYEVGDELYIFGFSRGAYTARSLCGLVRKCGILRRECFDKIPDAIAKYRDRKTPPHEVGAFRQAHAHHFGEVDLPVATGPEDLPDSSRHIWSGRYPDPSPYPPLDDQRPFIAPEDDLGDDEGRPGEDLPSSEKAVSRDWLNRQALLDRPESHERRERHEEAADRVYRLMFLGLWDTVGSLGVPTRFPLLSSVFNKRYRFHDTDASALMTSLRHAVAVDENRRVFDVSPVSNIEDLNRQWADAMGLPWPLPYYALPYQQRWFPGDHGAVGGGNLEPGLSSAALLWVAEGAQIEGLYLRDAPASSRSFVRNELSEATRLQNPLANWRITRGGLRKPPWMFDLLGFIGGYRDRKGPLVFPETHESARQRWARIDTYRPSPLHRFTGRTGPIPLYRILAWGLYPPVLLLLAALVILLAAAIAAIVLNGAPTATETLCRWALRALAWLKALGCAC